LGAVTLKLLRDQNQATGTSITGYKNGSLTVIDSDYLTFPPKAESFVNVYPRSFGESNKTREVSDKYCDGRIALLHRWQDQDDQWHVELLNDE